MLHHANAHVIGELVAEKTVAKHGRTAQDVCQYGEDRLCANKPPDTRGIAASSGYDLDRGIDNELRYPKRYDGQQ
jgi:hypothetical protein